MPVTVPAAVDLHTDGHGAGDRGVTGTPGLGVKVAGNLPLTGGAAQLNNNSGSSATGPLDLAHFGLGPVDVTVESKVLIWTWQFNAPNRIQVSTTANDGIALRIGSGAGNPPPNYKHYRIGGRDTFAGKSQQGALSVVIDLADVSQDAASGAFDPADVQSYGMGCVRHNMTGTSTAYMFFQRAFLFDTEVNGSRPEFTGLGSSWDDLVSAVLGSDYTDQISNDWIRKSGTTINVFCPWQIGDGVTPTTFDDAGVSINGPAHNAPDDPRFRLTSQSMRCAIRLRDDPADVVTLSGTYNYADSRNPDCDFDVSNASTINIAGSRWVGRGVVLLGSSVQGAASFAQCTEVVINGANLDGSIIAGDARLTTETDLTDITVTGDLYIATGADSELTFNGVTVTGSVFNDSGGNTLTINSTGGSSLTAASPGLGAGQANVVVTGTLTVTGVPAGAEIRIYELDATGIDMGTELQGTESHAGGDYVYSHSTPLNDIAVQVIHTGFRELVTPLQLPASGDTSYTARLVADESI